MAGLRPDKAAIYEELLADPNIVFAHRYPHNIALLRDVRREGYMIALATHSHREQARRVLSILGLAEEFDVIVTRDDVEHGKPDPEMQLLAARELGWGRMSPWRSRTPPRGSRGH